MRPQLAPWLLSVGCLLEANCVGVAHCASSAFGVCIESHTFDRKHGIEHRRALQPQTLNLRSLNIQCASGM
jgi:hypothetical protein